ncbi:glycine-rich domain-containing protein [Chitinophaga solisilvae]|uniref:glycine-rich domain-containing protein n=1 Tax=Chitinophaga solisilvae TaxID=1233460 RepID=UPI001371F859|nr:hypothetical protein [Chitinophaga solisilvae]
MKPSFSTILLPEEYQHYKENALWRRIDAYSPDNENYAIPFSRKLAVTEGWTRRFTLQAIREYKRFVYLCCLSRNGASPSVVVDKVWHMHLLYTVEYWKEFCPDVLGRELHHYPNVGGIAEYTKHQDWYLETLKLYLLVFEENPPSDCWRIPVGILPYLLPDKAVKRNFANRYTLKRRVLNRLSGIWNLLRRD